MHAHCSALNALLLLNFDIFPSKLTILAFFRYFLAIFLVPGHAKDPNNFLKTIWAFGFAHRVVKCELYSKK